MLYADPKPQPRYPDAVKRRRGWELTALRLERRSPLGFKTVNGQLVAVAGADQIPLPPGDCCWHTRHYSRADRLGGRRSCAAC